MNLGIGRLVILGTVLLAACAPAQPAAQAPSAPAITETRSTNQVIRIGQIGFPASPSPEASAANIPFYWAIYDSLTSVDQKFNVAPQAAERWSQPNPTTWRFVLRKGLTFSNGDSVTADDVAFTGKLILDTKMPQLTSLANLVDVKVVDEQTVDFVTKIPDASVLPAVAGFWIMPKKYYTQVDKSGFAQKPVGSGPYEVAEFRSGDLAVLKKRTSEHAFRKVVASELTFRSITDQVQLTNGLKTGDLDFVYGQINPDRIDALNGTDVVIQTRLSSVVSALFSQPENKERNTPLTDKRVRLALNYALDRETIAKQVFKGYGRATGQVNIPDSPGWDDAIKPFPFDPAKAKQMLAEAGYPNGFKLPVGIDYTPQTGNPIVIQALQSALRDIGVEAAANSTELGVFLDKYYGRNGQSKGDIWVSTVGDTNGFGTVIKGQLTCNVSLPWWCSPEFDRNMDLAAGEPDVAKRSVFFKKAIAALNDDVSHMPLFLVPTFALNLPKIKGFVWTSTSHFNVDSMYRIN